MRAPKQFVDCRTEEEGIAKSESGSKSHRRVGRDIGRNRRTRPQLARVREVKLVYFRRRQRAEQVGAEVVDLRRHFYSIRRISVSRHVKGLVRILRVVKVIRNAQLVFRSQVPVHLSEDRTVIDLVFNRQPLVLVSAGLEEIEERNSLTIGT